MRPELSCEKLCGAQYAVREALWTEPGTRYD